MRNAWTASTLGDVADYVNGYPFKPSDLGTEGLPVIRIKQLLNEDEPVDRTLTDVPEKCRLQDGDLVFSWSGTLAVRTWHRGPAALNQHLFRVVEKPGIDRRWLAVALEHAIADLASKTHGTTMKHITKGSLLPHPVLVPPPADQARIADLAAAFDMAIYESERLADLTRVSWRALADDLIGSFERDRQLMDGVLVTMGRQRSPKHASGNHMLPYLRAANVTDGRLELEDVLLMNFTPKEQQNFGLLPGDVLVTEGCGSLEQLGASASWSGEMEGMVCFQNTLLRLRALDGITDPGYVHHLARYAHRAGWWAAIASGTNIFHIGSERAKGMPAPFPTLDEQRTTALVLDAIDDVVRKAECEADALMDARERVLCDLLTGDHRIPNSYDELLERAS